MKIKGAAVLALLGLGLVAAGAGASSSPRPAPPRPDPEPYGPPEPDPDPSLPDPDAYYIGPGWFWYFVDWAGVGRAFLAWTEQHRGNVMVRKLIGEGPKGRADPANPYTGHDVVIFEVTIEPVEWTLPGLPTPAPRGADTDMTDLTTAPSPEATPLWLDWLLHVSRSPIETVQRWDQALQSWLDGLRGWR